MALGLFDDSPEAWQLPHQAIPLAVFLIVEEAIRFAWDLMQHQPRVAFQLHRPDEDPRTAELYDRLTNEVFNRDIVRGFDTTLLTIPMREPKVANYDRTNTELMPDMVIGFVGRPYVAIPNQDFLFIECKPIQVGRAAGAHYCDRGIIRFVRGDYAWAMTSALMVGYATARYRVLPKLTTALHSRANITTTVTPHQCRHSRTSALSEPTHISEHRRTFRYTQTRRHAPPISLRHLWLKRE